ncbi:CATRA conflict system CASPASE/TPR repeat-associated protein [Actinoplanes sp. NPDC051411]|uniref:CATRA conflict system CASPASE/TPR repeat-associated protein n=1 Tax=Actinoplanes sp. NPDC051411 TaxID=3155522 RepID=UPI0034325D14
MRVFDPEMVVHVFAPLSGPRADEAYAEARRIWLQCRLLLGMEHPIPQWPQHLPASLADLPGGAEVVLAAQERTGADFQAIARRLDDVLNLSVILSSRDTSRPDWSELVSQWSTVAAPWPTELLRGAHLYQAKIEGGTPQDLDATLAQALAGGLPVALPERWWTGGDPIGADVVAYSAVESGNPRSTVVLAAAERAAELNAWTWSDGQANLPPAARRLLHPSPAPAHRRPSVNPAPAPVTDLARRVLVCTSDTQVRDRMHAFLRLIDLKPVERNECVEATRKTMPTTREVMIAGQQLAQATIVVATPEEVSESGTLRPSQDLVFEAGIAIALSERQVILVIAGDPMLPVGMRDGGIVLDDEPVTKASIVWHLKLAGCEPDTDGTTWLAPGPFLGLEAYTRGRPGSGAG